MNKTTFLCSFSIGIDELSGKDQRIPAIVLKAIADAGRFSVFEATANDVIARTVTDLFDGGYLRDLKTGGFPWIYVELTGKGRALLGMEGAADSIENAASDAAGGSVIPFDRK